MFDWESFADSVRFHCLHSKNFDHKIEQLVLSSASIFFSFVKDGKDDVNTPCWVQLDVLEAFHQAEGTVSRSDCILSLVVYLSCSVSEPLLYALRLRAGLGLCGVEVHYGTVIAD